MSAMDMFWNCVYNFLLPMFVRSGLTLNLQIANFKFAQSRQSKNFHLSEDILHDSL
jgi:hypothetical protein